jgi:hypothetical protein
MDIENDPTEMKSLSKAATPEFQGKTSSGLIVARSAEVLSKVRLILRATWPARRSKLHQLDPRTIRIAQTQLPFSVRADLRLIVNWQSNVAFEQALVSFSYILHSQG